MLGRHTGDVTQTLAGVRLAFVVDPTDRAWPQRCAPFAQPAVDAMNLAWRSNVPGAEDQSSAIAADLAKGDADSARPLLQALQPFWVREPAPNVPLAPTPVFPRLGPDSRPFFDRAFTALDVTFEDGNARLEFEGGEVVCKIDGELRSACAPFSPTRVPIDGELGATPIDWNPTTGQLLRRDGTVVPHPGEGKLWMRWGHSYANDRLVVVDGGGVVTEWNHGRVTQNPVEITTTQRSTSFVDGWALWKDTREFLADGKLVAMRLSDGAKATPQPLGTLARPRSFVAARTYALCRGTSVFVDMDPSLVVLAGGTWKMVEVEQALNGRHIECHGDTAMIAEWAPPAVRRCDVHGCTSLTLPAVAGRDDDELASDGETLYQLELRESALLLAIQPLPTGPRRVVPIIDAYAVSAAYSGRMDRGMLHAGQGRVLLTLARKTDGHPLVVAVEKDGTTRVLIAGE